jgi:hypothetical protein
MSIASLAGLAVPAAAVVPEPPINGVVVQDFIQPFSFDRVGVDFVDGPFVDEDAYQGTVHTRVIRAVDNTFDFYFRFDVTSGRLHSFDYQWQKPVAYTVAYHVQEPDLPWAPGGPSSPAPGTSATGARSLHANWTESGSIPSGGSLLSGVLLLDTDATAYARNATFQIGDMLNGMQGFYSGESPVFTTFGPAVPEPEAYALMVLGLGGVAWAARRRKLKPCESADCRAFTRRAASRSAATSG